jgi:ubiquinone/menaquinone biosynthesis C-methylase UbiE
MLNIFKSVTKMYNKTTNTGKVLFFVALFLLLVSIMKRFGRYPSGSLSKEGFQSNESFLFKNGIMDIYDSFYSNIYDFLVFSNVRTEYEIGELFNQTFLTSESIVLDVGSGTGHHVSSIQKRGVPNVTGIDISPSMVQKAKEMYPDSRFKQGDITQSDLFPSNSFTHILCMYFTIYYIQNKEQFFRNVYNYLMPGGYFVLHLVNREKFDFFLPSAFSSQNRTRPVTSSGVTDIKFNGFDYSGMFHREKNSDKATFSEKFKFDDGKKVRTQEHKLYMEPEQEILSMVQEAGFISHGIVDLSPVEYGHQYLYIFVKPAN